MTNEFPHPMSSLTKFSAGYDLLSDVLITPNTGEVPRVDDHLYGSIQDRSYKGVATPIIFRIPGQNVHFVVQPSDDVALDTLEVPPDMFESFATAGSDEILVARPDHARQLFRLAMVRQFAVE